MYGILFTVIAAVALIALVYMAVVRSQADTSSQSTVVANAAPTVDTVLTAIASGGVDQATVSPTESSTARVYLRGVATDNNGCNDIDTPANWAYRSYRTDIAGGNACTADNNDCYVGNTTNLTFTNCTGAGDLNLDYEGYVDLQFYGDATDTGSANAATTWTSWVRAVDESASATGELTDTYEYNSLIALGVDAAVNYGTVVLGADSSVQTVTFTQTGNRSFDFNRSADGDMVCNGQGSSNIPIGQVKRHLTDSAFAWTDAAAAAISTTATEDEFNMGRRTNDGVALTKAYYMRLRMPATGLRGTCTNTATFTAIAEEAA
jgi:hypothetical protein